MEQEYKNLRTGETSKKLDEIKIKNGDIIREQNTDKQIDNKPWLWKKGQSGNLKGRPKGKTIKELVREWLEEHPDDMKAFVEHFVKKNKELAWQMMEGRPQQDITSAGEKIIPIPIMEVKKDSKDINKEDK